MSWSLVRAAACSICRVQREGARQGADPRRRRDHHRPRDSVAPDAKPAARAAAVEAIKRRRFRRPRGRASASTAPIRPGATRGPGGGDRRRARRDSVAQGRRAGGDHGRGARVARGRRAGADAALGDDGDADGDPERRLDRRDRGRSRFAARGAGDGAQRSRQGDARAPDAGAAGGDRLARRSASPRRAPTAATSSTASTTIFNDLVGLQGRVRAGARHGLRRQDADPSQPDRNLQRGLRADRRPKSRRARAIIAAFALPENAGKGAIQLDGRMVELLHAEMARRTLAVAEGIEALPA